MDERYYLSWQGKMQGPHTVEEIRDLLRDRKIHSLFKVQREGRELLVRDFLSEVSSAAKEAEKSAKLPSPGPVAAAQVIPRAIPVPEEELASSPPALPVTDEGYGGTAQLQGGDRFGFAVTSFVLSMLFAVPFVNLMAWVLSLIFGHLFLASTRDQQDVRGRMLAWCGVWFSYIFGGFSLVAVIMAAIWGDRVPSYLADDLFWELVLIMHGSMIVGAINGIIIAGLLVAGVKMFTQRTPKFPVALVAGTLAAMSDMVLRMTVFTAFPSAMEGGNSTLVVGLCITIAVFAIQALVWADLVHLRSGERLGFAGAALVGLFCSVCLLFISFALLGLVNAYT
ncbi:hypothetical protein [Haloferula sp. A504]|uniref:hypothetical protein n=1 Tax=Haloferula sp. A504 TaxID=3373601 RepID=UPI0031C8537D|nr:hypothetical protein [Verrucomicrobiaceae bacterium E54]